jgi:two-component system, OmpR family, response regulator
MDHRAGHILVVDGDSTFRSMLTQYLNEHDLPAIGASNRSELSRNIQVGPALIVLDLQLGQVDGLDVLRDLRSNSDVPVIIITGKRTDEIDRVTGLELGADDYILKPFSPRELLARIRAVLRRRHALNRHRGRGGYRFAGWRLERLGRKLTDPNGNLVPIAKSDFALLLAFLEAPQLALSREYLLQSTHVHEDIFDRSIDVRVLRLRRKLEADANGARMIQTAYGIGYFFACGVEPF